MASQALRWGILALAVLASAGTIYYEYEQSRPCIHPVPYSIGSVDSSFGVSNATLLQDVEAAAKIWNTAAGKEVLVYQPAGDLKINLVYDAREANAALGSEIAGEQAQEDTVRAGLDAQQAQFAAAQAAYNQQVNAINAQGGATREQAAALEQERLALSAQAESINAAVRTYNASVAATNVKVRQYDQSAGKTFEEGEYVRDSSGRRINIFEFVGQIQLERVLAHELGHAIGLDHNTNPKSIMFAQNEAGNLLPSADDLAALKALCGS